MRTDGVVENIVEWWSVDQRTSEVKKAMNKSFQESGGTVLSTNWEDIAKKTTEVKPPDSMEFKKWD